MNGTTPLEISIIFVFDKLAATYKFNPTGGVNKPIAKLIVINTPNTVGSTPSDNMIGNKIGTKI